jgi:hypothetical protein
MSGVTYFLVLPQHLEDIWPRMAPWIMQSLDGDYLRPGVIQAMKADIARGANQLWGAHSEKEGILAVAITEAIMIGGKRALVVRHMGGKGMKKWLDALAFIERWAMQQDIEVVEIWGRPGWIRVLAPYGYRHSFHVLEKVVSKELH